MGRVWRGTGQYDPMVPDRDATLPCPRCGAIEWLIERPPRIAVVRRWLEYGRRSRNRPRARRCARCRFEEQVCVGSTYVMRRPRPWTAPWRLIHVLLEERSMMPTPRMYVVAAVVGAAIATITAPLLRWPSWTVAVFGAGAVALTWLLFLASILTGPARSRDLRSRLLQVVSPHRGAAHEERRMERMLRAVPFAVFGLAGWTGERMLGGRGIANGVLSRVELLFGDPLDETRPVVRIESSPERRIFPGDRHLGLGRSTYPPSPEGLSRYELGVWMRRREEELDARPVDWTAVVLPVEGAATQFDVARAGDESLAIGQAADVWVTVHAERADTSAMRLERVRDIEPFIEGSRAYRARITNGRSPRRAPGERA